jgi:hypothetical protein
MVSSRNGDNRNGQLDIDNEAAGVDKKRKFICSMNYLKKKNCLII